MYYVYRYMHPDYPWLYVGKTIDLDGRIRSHDNSNNDNIDRKYAKLLLESTVYFLTLNNSAQMNLVELYLIDKYKPYLNKKDKHNSKSTLELKIPKWEKYIRSHEFQKSDLAKNAKKVKKEIEIIDNEIAELETVRSNKIAEISSFKKSIEQLTKIESDFHQFKIDASSILRKSFVNNSNKSFYHIDTDEINLIFKEFPESNLKFYLDLYNAHGDAETMLSDKNGIWTYTNFNEDEKKFICQRDSLLLDCLQSARETSVTHFYSTSISPYILLKTIYENRLFHLKIELNDLSHMIKEYTFKELINTTLSTQEGDWYEDKDKIFQVFVANGDWEMFDLNKETSVSNIKNDFLKNHQILMSANSDTLYEKYIDKINSILDSNILWINQKYKQRYDSINVEIEKCKKKIKYYSEKINTSNYGVIKDNIA